MSIDLKKRLLAFTLLLAIPAFATDGYFSTGLGVQQQGQGGALHQVAMGISYRF
jgi:hypothetical protein